MIQLLRCMPEYFEVKYTINAYMQEGTVDREKAVQQWGALNDLYRELGIELHFIEGQPGFPDMVFSANQTLPFRKDGKMCVLLSNMHPEQRRGEVPFYKEWFESRGYETFDLPEGMTLEGMGDNVYHGDGSFFWGGYGYRTSPEAHAYIEKITGLEVKPLKLVGEHGYHLNVALGVLDEKTALANKAVFDEASWKLLQEHFEDLIEVSHEDAMRLVCNFHCPDGKNVIVQEGSTGSVAAMRERGFIVHEVDTSEFMKAGGSVFCMKLQFV